METVIVPGIFDREVKGLFTGKTPGVDLGRIAELFSIGQKNIYMPMQRHTDKIQVLYAGFESAVADAVITNQRHMVIGVQAADCVPVLLYDKTAHVIGAVHAGWRGTAAEIVKKTIRIMTDRFCSSPSTITVAMGPGIRWCCYGVGYEVIEAVQKVTGAGDYVLKKGDRYCLDLPTANSYQALSMGVRPENIWMSDECTFCHPEKYYSYRFAKVPTGRQGGFIGMT